MVLVLRSHSQEVTGRVQASCNIIRMLLISSNVYYCIVFVSLYVIICLLYWITQVL